MTLNPESEHDWFSDEPEQEHVDGFRFYADGSYREPTEADREAEARRRRRYWAFRSLAKRNAQDAHRDAGRYVAPSLNYWTDREGFEMRVKHWQPIARIVEPGPVYYLGAPRYYAEVKHPTWRREGRRRRRTRDQEFKAAAVADGLELMAKLRFDHQVAARIERGRLQMREGRLDWLMWTSALVETFAYGPMPVPKGLRSRWR